MLSGNARFCTHAWAQSAGRKATCYILPILKRTFPASMQLFIRIVLKSLAPRRPIFFTGWFDTCIINRVDISYRLLSRLVLLFWLCTELFTWQRDSQFLIFRVTFVKQTSDVFRSPFPKQGGLLEQLNAWHCAYALILAIKKFAGYHPRRRKVKLFSLSELYLPT